MTTRVTRNAEGRMIWPNPDHDQVDFETRRGELVTVDEGLLEVLTLLKELGVETLYSCQGNHFDAYVCAYTKGFDSVIRRALSLYRKQMLSGPSMRVIWEFIHGEKELDFSASKHFGAYYRDGDADHFRFSFRKVFHINQQKTPHRWAYEREWTTQHGRRTVLRWPPDKTFELEQLLKEL